MYKIQAILAHTSHTLFYIFTLVFHGQSHSIEKPIKFFEGILLVIIVLLLSIEKDGKKYKSLRSSIKPEIIYIK